MWNQIIVKGRTRLFLFIHILWCSEEKRQQSYFKKRLRLTFMSECIFSFHVKYWDSHQICEFYLFSVLIQLFSFHRTRVLGARNYQRQIRAWNLVSQWNICSLFWIRSQLLLMFCALTWRPVAPVCVNFLIYLFEELGVQWSNEDTAYI